MIKFELDKVDENFARFVAEFDPTPKSDDYTNGTYYFTMQKQRWANHGRPIELLVSVEGLTTK
jgi:hypothetical protein